MSQTDAGKLVSGRQGHAANKADRGKDQVQAELEQRAREAAELARREREEERRNG